MKESVRYLREFRRQGVQEVVLTPHLLVPSLDRHSVDTTLASHQRRFQELLEALEHEGPLPRLGLGQEILARNAEELGRVVARPDVGLGGGSALLVEFGFLPGFDGDGVVEAALAEGRQIVLAHPERYGFHGTDPVESVKRWRDLGAFIQVNGGSLAGLYTPRAQEMAIRLLEEGLVDIVGSDHHGDMRSHSPAMILEEISALTNPAAPSHLMGDSPRRVLELSGAHLFAGPARSTPSAVQRS